MSKIKLVPVPNITKRELMTALMDGRRFTVESSGILASNAPIIHWDSNFGNCPVRECMSHWNWRGFKHLHELVEQQWYEDPDMVGKPVKVRDSEKDEWRFSEFASYEESSDRKFMCNQWQWVFCEPLTASDLYQEQV